MYFKLFLIIVLIASLIFVSGCVQEQPTEQPVESMISREEAIQIAENSECVKDGSLTGKILYNENTKTWWMDLDIEKEGCSPACVVNAETKQASINWRCTGAIPE